MSDRPKPPNVGKPCKIQYLKPTKKVNAARELKLNSLVPGKVNSSRNLNITRK
jgi:hypothetical protein